MRGKKAQLSMFILVGIVLMIVFGMIFFMSAKISKIKLENKAKQIEEEVMRTTAFEFYVNQCLERASKETIWRVGEQGGPIYTTQLEKRGWFSDYRLVDPYFSLSELYGKYVIPFKDGDIIMNTSFGIMARSKTAHPIYANEPDYPYKGKLSNPILGFPFKSTIVGKNIVPLCINNGSNAWNLGVELGVDIASDTCKNNYDVYRVGSIQEHMQLLIAEEVKKCANFSDFAWMLGYNVTQGNVTSDVVFGENDIGIKINYPILISVENHEPITRMLNFKTTLPVRFKEIYFAVKRIIEQDSRDIFFDMLLDSNAEKRCKDHDGSPMDCIDEDMNITKFYKVCEDKTLCPGTDHHSNFSDIVRITDKASLIDGKPYFFQFAIENRKPALDEIKNVLNPDPYHIIVLEGDNITIDPYGYDPDEDYYGVLTKNGERYVSTTYNYTGWKETENSTFDFDCCNAQDCTTYEGLLNCVKRDLTDKPYKWTTETPYITTRRNATYGPTTANDTGVHIVRVKVCDDEKDETNKVVECDFQDVKILVINQPQPVIETYNIFGDDEASIEDPFTFDASDSIMSIAGQGEAEWFYGLDSLGTDLILKLPYQTDSSIKNIRPLLFSSPGLKTVTLELRTPNLPVMEEPIMVDVKECIPHISAIPSYPYMQILPSPETKDAYMGAHTCCEDDGTRKGDTEICYTESSYTCAPISGEEYGIATRALKDTSSGVASDRLVTPEAPTITDNHKNDVWLREYTQLCSGNRGNICSGNVDDVFSVFAECDDLIEPGQTERCQGPSSRNKNNCPGESVLSSCINYGKGESFEEIFLGTGDGICNENRKCTDNTYINSVDKYGVLISPPVKQDLTNIRYHLQGEYSCKALCSDGNCKATDSAHCTHCDSKDTISCWDVCKADGSWEEWCDNWYCETSSGECETNLQGMGGYDWKKASGSCLDTGECSVPQCSVSNGEYECSSVFGDDGECRGDDNSCGCNPADGAEKDICSKCTGGKHCNQALKICE